MTLDTQPATLPILDLSAFNADPESRRIFLDSLRDTARNIGFFYLTGHGISSDLTDRVLGLSRAFFSLPEADKLAIEMVNSPHFRGYNRVGQERTKGQRDWREQVDIGPEQTALPTDDRSPVWARLEGPNQWPAGLPELKSVILQWQEEVTNLALRLLEAFAIALEQDKDVFKPIYEQNPNHLLKIIRYPGRDSAGSDQGVGAHKDSGFLTLLLQEKQKGLEVETDAGWIEAPPLEGTFIVNIGEVLELASDGYLRATVHRVVTPPAGVDRLSVAYFLGAHFGADVPLLELPDHLKQQARGLTRDPDNPLFRNIGQNTLKSRLGSHPDVAARHYPDLVANQADRPLAAQS